MVWRMVILSVPLRKHTSTEDDTGQALPQGSEALNPGDCEDGIGKAGVDGGGRRAHHLHPGL